jgi:hypothetical protein
MPELGAINARPRLHHHELRCLGRSSREESGGHQHCFKHIRHDFLACLRQNLSRFDGALSAKLIEDFNEVERKE